MGCSYEHLAFVWFVAILRFADGAGTITWYEPPPVETTADTNSIRTYNTPLTKGSTNEPLVWNFSLAADLNPLASVALEWNTVAVVNIFPSLNNARVVAGYEDRFNLSWINPVKATLIIFNVSAADEGEFACKLTTIGGGNKVWTRKIQVTVVVPPHITYISGNQTVNESESVTLFCNATGNPTPAITWTRLSDNRNVTFPLNISRQDQGGYRCTADNGVGRPATKETFITVQYPPNITHISPNQTVDASDTVSLNCSADGFPAPSITWTNVTGNNDVDVPLLISGIHDQGYYRCTADNGIGNPASEDVFITVQNYPPINTNLTTPGLTNNTVVINTSFNLTCSSQANPPAKFRFYREQQSLFNTAIGSNLAVNTTSVNERIKRVTYSCTPFNDYGKGPTQTITVTVHYPPERTNYNQTVRVPANTFVTLSCPVDGNPEPDITWYEGNDTSVTLAQSGKEWNFPKATSSDSGWYTCFANNSLNPPVLVRLRLLVELTKPSTPPQTTPNESTDIGVTCTITNKNCNDVPEVERDFPDEISNGVRLEGFQSVKIKDTRCGSVIVDLVLRFNKVVSESDVISALKTAAQGDFGKFTVDPDSIKATDTGSTQEPVCKETFIKDKNCSTIVWKIVVLAIAGVVLIAFVVGIVAWWVHKRRKCRKDPRIHHSEERLRGNFEDNAYSQVKHGYAGTGPRTNGTGAVALQQRAAADGRDAASHQQEATASPTYAEVDNSKKKKKEEKLDYTYAEVDKSKKSKKKPKPGEMIYADLEDINGPRPMPTVSTSPQPQAPIKRPEPYENTPYADITQFLKGDATLPQSDSNQGTELQPQDVSKDEGGAGGEDRNTPM